MNAEDAAFCSKCGVTLAPPRFCNRCAGPVDPGAVFCSGCGNNLQQPMLQPALVLPQYSPMVQFGAMTHVLQCPRCGSPAQSSIRAVYIVLAVLLFPIGLLFLLAPKAYQCGNVQCRLSW
jgi:ribosomal protein S27E